MNAVDNLKYTLQKVTNHLKAPVSERERFEREMERKLGKVWNSQRDELMKLLGDPPSLANVPQSYWNNGGHEIKKVIAPIFEEIFVSQSMAMAGAARIGVDWTLVNKQAANWAYAHAGQLIQGLQTTEQNAIRDYVQKYYTDGWTLDDVISHLEPLFDKQRATTIAITETTNAATQSEMAMVNYLEATYPTIHFVGYWITANDDRVCDICGPKHGKIIEDAEYPPAHVNCRCEVEYDVRQNG